MHHRLDLMPLRPYTNYFLSVAALTVKYGPEMNATFDTEQDIPEGVPTQLHYANISRSLDTLTWAEVPCGLRNGPITSYYVEIDSVDHWENKLRQTTVNSTSITYRGSAAVHSIPSQGVCRECCWPFANVRLHQLHNAYCSSARSWRSGLRSDFSRQHIAHVGSSLSSSRCSGTLPAAILEGKNKLPTYSDIDQRHHVLCKGP
ncbi:hypothetical protein MRX96_054754 [Rhipicephalus microplus]